jgi:photosystem II stability/assembly factor-like uncharacterized protein
MLGAAGSMALLVAVPVGLAGQWDMSHLDAIQARNIGPAGMSGRVADVEVVLSDPNVIFVGAATGGVFRSTDGGVTWNPVFDDQPVLGVGSIAVFQPNPALVWVGTGEGNPRNSAGVGNGIYKSIDGGETWSLAGLSGSERIHRVLTHPTDPDVVYAGVMGPAWSDGEVRGVYRTTDGGETWERVLHIDAGTGVAELVMDPANPDKLMAAMWDFRRDPWFFRSGGPGSGLYVTHDGGDTWVERTERDGLPSGELGRMGLAISPSNPEVVYALVEATRSALLRSDDGGRSFRTVNDNPGIVPRPFYYADLRIDPANENRIYSLHSAIQVSEDAGRTWRTVVPSAIIHGDVHELWIDPGDSRHMIIGNDGGIGISFDRGDHWRFVENLTLAQYYHVSLDDRVPYNIYGGLQDNGSWFGPSDVWETKGILNAHFTRVGGGDGFSVLDDPADERYGYSMSQGGALQRFDRITGHRESIQPVHPQGIPLRFNWNAGLALDPHETGTLYLGSQFVHRTRDHGASWEIISPDLTTNDPAKQDPATGGLSLDATGAETHTSVIAIAPSPTEPGVIWVGTDDGNVQLTRDGGASWTPVGENIRGVPAGTWVPDVQPSLHDPATAYVVFEDHRRGNWETYLYRTEDYGERWERLDGSGVDGFAHAIEEDPREPNLLFLGTEFGLYFSTDRGGSWQRWTHVPAMPVRDLKIHPREGDLVLGTHGRGLWVLDDIHPLRALARDGPGSQPLRIYEVNRAILHDVAEAIGYRSTGMAMWQGATRPYGALVYFGVHPDSGPGTVDVTVADAAGRAVRTESIPAEVGLNRWVWNLRAGGEVEESPDAADGAEVLPGPYTVTVEKDGVAVSGVLEVVDDPRVPPVSRAQMRARLAAYKEAMALTETANEARTRLRQVVEGVEAALSNLDGDLRAEGRDLLESLSALRERLFTGPECQGICPGDPVASEVGQPLRRLRGGKGAPTPLEEELLDRAEAALEVVLQEVNGALEGRVSAFRDALRAAGYTPLPELTPVRREDP